MSDNKYCPIFLTASPAPINKEMYWCKKDRCAWWRGNCCAIVDIAAACESIEYVGDAVADKS